MFREFVIAKQRLEDEHDRDVTLAYKTASLHRRQKLPKLETLLTKRRKRQQTMGEMRTTLHLLAAQYGGSVRKGGSGKAAHGR